MARHETDKVMREFEGGAIRDADLDKVDYAGFLSPLALEAYGSYMHKNRFLEDGRVRDSDNWKKGIPPEQYLKSLMRHVHDAHMNAEGWPAREGIEEALCGILFNAMGWLHEIEKGKYGG